MRKCFKIFATTAPLFFVFLCPMNQVNTSFKNPTTVDYNYFFTCCCKGTNSQLKAFLEKNEVNFCQKTKRSSSCLHFATRYNTCSFLKCLIELLEEKKQLFPLINDRSKSGESALSIAIAEGFLDKTMLLINKKASITIKPFSPDKETLLTKAIASGNKELLLYFLEKLGQLEDKKKLFLLKKRGGLGLTPREYLHFHFNSQEEEELQEKITKLFPEKLLKKTESLTTFNKKTKEKNYQSISLNGSTTKEHTPSTPTSPLMNFLKKLSLDLTESTEFPPKQSFPWEQQQQFFLDEPDCFNELDI